MRLLALLCLVASISWPTVYNKEMNVNPFVPGSQFIQNQEEEQTGLHGIWWDETLWTPIQLPPGLLICQPDSAGALHCWRIFPGSILVVPTQNEGM